jgi:hypothetical protein
MEQKDEKGTTFNIIRINAKLFLLKDIVHFSSLCTIEIKYLTVYFY